jgi:hypothetical protein
MAGGEIRVIVVSPFLGTQDRITDVFKRERERERGVRTGSLNWGRGSMCGSVHPW